MASTSNSADIGIRVLLEDAASAGLQKLGVNLGNLGHIAKTSGMLFGDLSAKMATLAVAAGLGAAFLGFGGAIIYSVQQSMDLNNALVLIANAIGVTTDQISQLQPFLMNLGASSIYSLQQLADGIATVGQYGFKTTQQIEDLATAGKNLAEATGSDTVTAFKLLAVTMQAFNIPASQAQHTADLLFYSVEHGTPDMTALTTALGELGGVSKELGISLQDIVPALDVVTVGMGNASSAAAGLRYFLTNIVHPTRAAAAELNTLGISAFDANGKFIGLSPILQDIYNKVQNLSDEGKANALGTLFNIRSGTAIKQLLNQLGQYQQAVKNVSDGDKLHQQLMQAVANVMDQLGSIIHVVTSNLQDFAALVGQSVSPQLIGFLNNAVVPLVSNMRSWASDPANARIVSSVLLIGTALSGIGLAIMGVVLTPVGAFLAIMLSVMAVVGGAAIGIEWLRNNWARLQPVLNRVKDALPFVASGLLLVAAGLLAINAVSIAGKISKLAGELQFAAQYAGLAAQVFFTETIPALWAQVTATGAAKVAWLQGLIPALARAAAQAWTTTASFLSGLGPAIASTAAKVWTAVTSFVAGIIPALVSAAVKAWSATTAFLSGLGPALVSAATGAWSATTAFVAGIGPAIAGAAVAAWRGVVAFVAGMIPALLGTATAAWSAAAGMLAVAGPFLLIGALIAGAIIGLVLLIQHFGGLNAILAVGKAIWAAILPPLQQAGNEIKGAFLSALKQLQPAWQQMVAAFKQAEPFLLILGKILGGIIVIAIGLLIGIIRGLINVFVTVIVTVIKVVAGIIQAFAGIITFFSGFFKFLHGLFTGNWKEMLDGIKTMGAGILQIFTGLWNAVSALFVGVFKAITGFVTGFIQGIIGFFTGLWNTLTRHSIIPDMLNDMLKFFIGIGPSILSGIGGWIGNIIKTFQGLPGKILSALGNLNSLLINAGRNLIQGFINGIESMISSVKNTVGNLLNNIRNMFPHSPAKEGPLTDAHLWMPNLINMLSDTAVKAGPSLKSSMSQVAGGARAGLGSPTGSAGGGAGAAGEVYNLQLDGKTVMSFFHNRLTGELQANGIGRVLR